MVLAHSPSACLFWFNMANFIQLVLISHGFLWLLYWTCSVLKSSPEDNKILQECSD